MLAGNTGGLLDYVMQLLRQQAELLETTDALSKAELDGYEKRSEHIRELIAVLASNEESIVDNRKIERRFFTQ
jgi:hypothetical protein